MENETVKLKQYLLGNLPPRETEEIDLQILTDGSLEEKLLWAESELSEDFLEGGLTPEEIKLFHSNFLISAERKNLLKEIALLKKFAETQHLPLNQIKKNIESPKNFWQLLKDFLSQNMRPVGALAALLIIALAIGFTWKLFFDETAKELTQAEKQYAEINRRDLSSLSEFQNYSNLSLIPGALRDTNSASKFKQENLTENIFFRLALPFEVNAETLFNVQLLKDKNPVFNQHQVRVYKNQSGHEVRFVLPKSIFQKGQYQIKLENPALGDAALTYNLTME